MSRELIPSMVLVVGLILGARIGSVSRSDFRSLTLIQGESNFQSNAYLTRHRLLSLYVRLCIPINPKKISQYTRVLYPKIGPHEWLSRWRINKRVGRVRNVRICTALIVVRKISI